MRSNFTYSGSQKQSINIGILQCDHVNRGNFPITNGDYDKIYTNMLLDAAKRTDSESIVLTSTFPVIDNIFPDSSSECDSWIITSSRYDSYGQEDWISRLREFTLDIAFSKKPLVGICFGHQLISLAMGGEVKRMNRWIAGTQEVFFSKNNVITRKCASLIGIHRDQVTVPPRESKIIGSTRQIKVAAQLLRKNILTTQYHSELSAEYVSSLLSERRAQIGESEYNNAMKNLFHPTDSASISDMIFRFLTKKQTQQKRHIEVTITLQETKT